MEPNQTQVNQMNISRPKGSAKDFFLNLGAIVALYTVVISLLNLLFTVINKAYPQITNGYNYYGSTGISWPVAVIIVAYPIFVLLMWLLEKAYAVDVSRRHLGIRRWLIYITLFVGGIVLAGDLITVLYYFIDGQELTTGFLLKVLSVLVVTGCVFIYYISDIRGKLTSGTRKIWFLISIIVILVSIAWGFSVLGSPRTQRLLKYDEQKVMDLQNINSQIQSYYQINRVLPQSLTDITTTDLYFTIPVDSQTGESYEYQSMATSTPSNTTYKLCAKFNRTSDGKNDSSGTRLIMPYYGNPTWNHQGGYFCFTQTINPLMYPKIPVQQ